MAWIQKPKAWKLQWYHPILMLRFISVLSQLGSTPCKAPQPVPGNQKLEHPKRRPRPWAAAAAAAACPTRVTLPLRAWRRARTQAWSALHPIPNPHPQMGVCLWMEVAVEVEQREYRDQCGTIPVTAMRDVQPGDQDTGREGNHRKTRLGRSG